MLEEAFPRALRPHRRAPRVGLLGHASEQREAANQWPSLVGGGSVGSAPWPWCREVVIKDNRKLHRGQGDPLAELGELQASPSEFGVKIESFSKLSQQTGAAK